MTTLYQLKLDQSIADCGMSYVYQLKNGHYFLIDGGYFTPGEAERLYRFLCAHCEGKPVIEGWFFSHAHQDHIGVFLDMVEQHRQDIELRELIYNFQPLELPETSEGWRMKNNDLATVRRFYEDVAAYCAHVPVRTPHAGDCWQVGELTIEALLTYDLLDEPTTFNDHSTVLRITCGGQAVLFLGDVFEVGSRILLTRCPEKLRCDLVQVSHHCFAGATRALYQATEAKVALWSAADYAMRPNRDRDANHYLLYEAPIQEHFLNAQGDKAFRLPYRVGTAQGQVFDPASLLDIENAL